MVRLIDRISDAFGAFAAAIFFIIGAMITYEVVARYVFLAPTSWAEEGARLLQLWATYLALGYALKNKVLIRISALTTLFPIWLRRALDIIALLWIIGFCAVAVWYGIEIVVETFEVGRTTATMNQVHKAWTETAIPVGFSILILQALVEIWKLLRGAPPSGEIGDPEHEQVIQEAGS